MECLFVSERVRSDARAEHGNLSQPSERVDALVRQAQSSTDNAARMAAFGEIQQILFDEVALIGNYERGRVYATDPRVKGILRRVFGAEVDYTNAYIEVAP